MSEGAAERHGVAQGDHVMAEQIIPCNACRFCKNDQYWMCRPHIIFGFKRVPAEGGMAEYMIYPANARVHTIDSRIDARRAAYIEPPACAMHAVDRGEIHHGDVVVMAGMGNIRLCMLQAAKRFNPGLLIAVDTKNYRLDMAKKLGADIVINPQEEDAAARVKSLTEGYGCDVFIEASGSALIPQMGLNMIRRLGTFVAVLSAYLTLLTRILYRVRLTSIRKCRDRAPLGRGFRPACEPIEPVELANGLISLPCRCAES